MTPTLSIVGMIAIAVAVVASGHAGAVVYKYYGPKLAKPAFTEHCIGKVTYIQFDNAVVTKLKPDGKVWTCGGV